jgi:hypothetical protein
MSPGWPYSIVAALETGRTSWTTLLDAIRLPSGADLTTTTCAQIRQLVDRLTADDQRRRPRLGLHPRRMRRVPRRSQGRRVRPVDLGINEAANVVLRLRARSRDRARLPARRLRPAYG